MSQTRITCDKPMGYDAKTVTELKVDTNKSPLEKLSEIMKMSGKEDVVYKVLKVTKSSYGNVLVVEASNSEMTAIGQGTTKSSAESDAAFNLLSQIYDNINNTFQKPSTSNVNQLPSINCQKSQIEIMSHKSSKSTTSSICEFIDSSSKEFEESYFDNDNSKVSMATSSISHSPSLENKYLAETNSKFLEINYVGLVQEFCIAHHLELPKYCFSPENSERNVIIFRVTCSLLNFKSFGKGNSKQLAKRCAAYEMYLHLENLSKMEIDVFKPKPSNSELSKASLKSLNRPSGYLLSSKSVEHLEMFFSKNDLSYKVLVDFLNSIARDEGFSVNFIEISKELGNSVVLVQLIADRVYVFDGRKKNIIEANCAAIHSVLVWLQSVAQNSSQKIE